jgi:hypothetical protein
MLFSQTIDNIDSEITALLARVEAAKQRQTQFRTNAERSLLSLLLALFH